MGALVMTHADDNGLRLPPLVAPKQVVIVPITRDDPAKVEAAAEDLAEELRGLGTLGAPLRVSVDTRERKPPRSAGSGSGRARRSWSSSASATSIPVSSP